MSCFLLSLPLWGKALCGEAGHQMKASPFSACLSACLPAILGPGIVPVPGMGFKFVNNFPFGLVDVMGLGKSFHSLHLLPCLISSHSTMSQALVVYPFSSYPQGPVLLCPHVPFGCLVQALYHFLYCPTLSLALFPCRVLSLAASSPLFANLFFHRHWPSCRAGSLLRKNKPGMASGQQSCT